MLVGPRIGLSPWSKAAIFANDVLSVRGVRGGPMMKDGLIVDNTKPYSLAISQALFSARVLLRRYLNELQRSLEENNELIENYKNLEFAVSEKNKKILSDYTNNIRILNEGKFNASQELDETDQSNPLSLLSCELVFQSSSSKQPSLSWGLPMTAATDDVKTTFGFTACSVNTNEIGDICV
jgi:hypothetical protein